MKIFATLILVMNRAVFGVLNKKMTRTEFLRYLGLMMVSVIGISTMLKNLSELDPKAKKTNKLSSSGKRTFGSGAYGV